MRNNMFALGTDTLHGGTVGFDRRNWTVAQHTSDSVTFTYLDPNGTEGFPGNMNTTVSVRWSASVTAAHLS